MFPERFERCCRGCHISRGFGKKIGGIIELEGNWILNHYGGPEGFLGWMALQPRYHRMEFAELTSNEVEALGRNIQKVEIGLRNYWSINFKDDPIERVYVVYFFDSIFDREPEPDKKAKPYHLHLHLIVRTQLMGNILRKKAYCASPNINAWMIYKLNKDRDFPAWYKRYDDKNKAIMELMTSLRIFLGSFFPLKG